MELKSFDTILVELCDSFDSLIAPKTIARSNSNVVYLLLKAFAKGLEVINNVCVSLSNKFDPAKCLDEDLDSVAELVGTERLSGSSSGLLITAVNNSGTDVLLEAGTYSYVFDDDTTFSFDILSPKTIPANSSDSFIAMSEEAGSFPVTAQEGITVLFNGEGAVTGLTFGCADNAGLLGTAEESNMEFRKRILSDTTRQDSLVELQTKLRNLPYLFDAKIFFNNTLDPVTYDGIQIMPYYMAVFFSGEPKNEIAKIIAETSIFPTVQTADSVELQYASDVFADGYYPVYIQPFLEEEYSVAITCHVDTTFLSTASAEEQIRTSLLVKLNQKIHKDYIKEVDIYNMIDSMNIAGVDILNVDLFQGETSRQYIQIPLSRIPKLTTVTFSEV